MSILLMAVKHVRFQKLTIHWEKLQEEDIQYLSALDLSKLLGRKYFFPKTITHIKHTNNNVI